MNNCDGGPRKGRGMQCEVEGRKREEGEGRRWRGGEEQRLGEKEEKEKKEKKKEVHVGRR